MEKNMLSEIIEVEKEIQRCIELEKAKSFEWLERTKKESENQIKPEEKKIAESLTRSVEDAKREAETKASDIVKQAAQKTTVMTMLNNETLSRIVGRHMNRILPG